MTKKTLLCQILLMVSALFCRSQFSPSDISGLEMWIKADAGVTLENGSNVSLWQDQSGNGHDCSQTFDYLRPDFITSAINGLPAIHFDGEDDFMQFPEVANIRTVFWVVKEDPMSDPNGTRRSLLGHQSTMYFLRGPSGYMWDPYAQPQVINGNTKLNFQVVDGQQTEVPDTFSLISLVTTDNAASTHLTMDLNIYGRTWWGDIAEIIIYNEVLDETQRLQVENYLADRYTPLLPDFTQVLIPYGFCDTLLCAPEGFQNYAWSEGTNTSCTTISQAGNYTLATTDAFGRSHLTSFIVEYPGALEIPDTTICAGEIFEWNTLLSNQDYNFLWSNQSTLSNFLTDSSGDYQLVVSDTTSCDLTIDFHVEVDGFPLIDLLPSAQDLCSGNLLIPSNSLNSGVQFLWGDNSTGNTLAVFASSEYSLIATDSLGCIATDATSVSIVGVAPDISLSANDGCLNSSINFNALLNSSDLISSWTWDFDDGNSVNGQNVQHIFTTAGSHTATLTAIASTGCISVLPIEINVFELPQPSYIYSTACQGHQVNFQNTTSTPLSNATWGIDGQTINSIDASLVIASSGALNVNLNVIDINGCEANTIGTILVLPSPIIEFTIEGNCFGDLTHFLPSINANGSGTVSSYGWSFGDNTSSVVLSPNHYYPSPNIYSVEFVVLAQNGCSTNYNTDIQIIAPPTADFYVSNACIGQDYLLVNEVSVVEGDPIVDWNWTIEGEESNLTPSPIVVFDTPGLHSVSLTIISSMGCTASIAQSIPVWESPIADFTWNPLAGQALYTMQFEEQSTGSNLLFEWSMNNLIFSENPNTEYTFGAEGTVAITLNVVTTHGCANSHTESVQVVAPVLDIALEEITLVEEGTGFKKVSFLIYNRGNIPVSELELEWQAGGELVLAEHWQGDLPSGGMMTYEMSSSFLPNSAHFDYVCSGARASNIPLTDARPEDNLICKSFDSHKLEVYPTFPNPGDDHLFVRFTNSVAGNLSIRITDETGNAVQEFVDANVGSGFHQYYLNIASLSNGIYVLSLSLGNEQKAVRFEKLHR